MKKTLLILLSLLLVVSVTFAFAACNTDDPCAEGHSWDDGTPQTPASCESAGVTVYRCRVCGKTETRSEPAKLGHDYTLQGWTWENDYSGATAHFTCSRGDLTATQDVTDDDLQSAVQPDGSTVYTASVTGPDGGVYTDTKTKPADGHRHTKGTKHDAQPATCTQAGVAEYWDCEANDGTKLNAAGEAVTDAQLALAALGHTYTVAVEPLTWKVSGAYDKAILHLVCSACADGTDGHTLDVELTAKQTTSDASTCGATGSITYTVSVEDTDNAAAITAAVVAPNKLAQGALDSVEPLTHTDNNAQRGHDWKLAQQGAFDWTGTTKDSASVKVKYVCQTCSKEITITFTDAVGTPTPATCTAAGHVEYTLTKIADQVKAAAQAAELQDVTIYDADTFEAITNEQSEPVEGDPATGHSWQVTEVVWASKYDDDPHATVTVKCSKCHIEYDEGEPEVTFAENKQDPECEVEGSVTYTVTVKVGGAELGFADEADKTSSAYTIPALGHEKDPDKYHALQDSTCTEQGTKEYWECKRCDAKLDAAGEEIDDITIAVKNHLYTDKYTNDGCSDGFHKRVCDNCSVAEEEPTACTPDDGDKEHDPDHQLAEGWYADGDYHWKKCELCGKEYGKERHDYQEYSSEVCVKCGHVHMDVEVSTNDDGSEPQHFNSVKEAFEWIAEQADKTKTYTIRLNHNRTSDDAENLTVSEGHKVVLDLESYSLTLNGGKLTVTGEESSLEVTGTGALNATVYYESGTLKLPENLLDKLKLGEGVKCVGENVHITIGDAALEHKWSQDNSFTDDSGHYQVCERCDEHNTLVGHDLQWVSDNETQHHQKCKDCGYTTEPVSHVEELKWVTTPTHHHQECKTCGYKSDDVEHSFTYSQRDAEECHNVSCATCGYTGTESCENYLENDVCSLCKKDYRITVTVHYHRNTEWTGSNVYIWAYFEGKYNGNCIVEGEEPSMSAECKMNVDSATGEGWFVKVVKYPREVTRHVQFSSTLTWTEQTSKETFTQNEIWCSMSGKVFASQAEAEKEDAKGTPTKSNWQIAGLNDEWGQTSSWDYIFCEDNNYTLTFDFKIGDQFKIKKNDGGWDDVSIGHNDDWSFYGIDDSLKGKNILSIFENTDNFKIAKVCTLKLYLDTTNSAKPFLFIYVQSATSLTTISQTNPTYNLVGGFENWTGTNPITIGTNLYLFQNVKITSTSGENSQFKIRKGSTWDTTYGYDKVRIMSVMHGVSFASSTKYSSGNNGNVKINGTCTVSIVFDGNAAAWGSPIVILVTA